MNVKVFILIHAKKTKKKQWPLLHYLTDQGYLSYIDFAIAEQFAQDECQAALHCFMSLASRSGHLCVKIDSDNLEPDLKGLSSSEIEIPDKKLDELKELIQQGVRSSTQNDDRFIQKNGNCFYFPKNWSFESELLKHICRIEQTLPKALFDAGNLEEKIALLENLKKLLPEQANAIRKIIGNAVTIICGGPGTGKTYTAGQMIRLIWESLSEVQKSTCQILLAAPTGKAAANLQQSLNQAVKGLESFRPIQAKTLHSLLGVNMEGKRKGDNLLNANILLIDECSMIDVQMMGHLFAAITPGTRVIMLGDKYQLPPVEAGSLFADLMTARPEWSVELKSCMRSDLKGILNLADAIKEGDFARCQPLLERGEGVSKLSLTVPDLMDYVFSNFPSTISDDPVLLMESFNRFRVLSALRKGPLGVDEFNQQIHLRAFKRTKSLQKYAEPIILTASDNQLDLFNGETGVIIKTKDKEDQGIAFFYSRKDKSLRSIPALLLPKYEYAYCLSVHKSQGSEFDRVVFLMPPRTQYFGREVLYTAVTRAKHKLEIWGDDEILRATILRSSKTIIWYERAFRSASS